MLKRYTKLIVYIIRGALDPASLAWLKHYCELHVYDHLDAISAIQLIDAKELALVLKQSGHSF